MSLSKEVIQVSLAEGIDSKSDRKLPTAKLEVSENCAYDRTGALRKRFGYDAVDMENVDASRGDVTGSVGLHAFGSQVLATDGNLLHAHSPALSRWRTVGALPNSFSRTQRVAVSARDLRNPTSARAGDLTFYAWEDNGYVYVSVRDESSGQNLVPARRAFAAKRPLVVPFNGAAALVAVVGSTVRVVPLTLALCIAGSFTASFSTSGISSDLNFDSAEVGTTLWLAFSATSGTTTSVVRLNTSYAQVGSTRSVPASSTRGVAVFGNSDGVAYVAMASGDSQVVVGAWTASDVQTYAPTQVNATLQSGSAVRGTPPGSPAWWLSSEDLQDSAGGMFSTLTNRASTGSLGVVSGSTRNYFGVYVQDDASGSHTWMSGSGPSAPKSMLTSSAGAAEYRFLHAGSGSAFAVSFRTPPALSSGNKVLLSTATSGSTAGMQLSLTATGSLLWTLGGHSGGTVVKNSSVLALDAPHTVAVRWPSSGLAEMWVDGANIHSASVSAVSQATPSTTLTLGFSSNNEAEGSTTAPGLSGHIGEVLLYPSYPSSGSMQAVLGHIERWRTYGTVPSIDRLSGFRDAYDTAVYAEAQGAVYRLPLVVTSSLSSRLGNTVANDAHMVTRPFRFMGSTCVGTCVSSSLEPTHVVVDSAGLAVARANVLSAGPRSSGSMPHVFHDGYTAGFATERAENFESEDSATQDSGSLGPVQSFEFGTFGVSCVDLLTGSQQSVRLHDGLHFPGSVVRTYDGDSVFELGFLTSPEVKSIRIGDDGEQGNCGDVEQGTYLYAFCYEHEDGKGQTHRSTPTVLTVVDVPRSHSWVAFELTPLNLTQRSGVKVVGYRSAPRVSGRADLVASVPLFRFTPVDDPVVTLPNTRGAVAVDCLAQDDIRSNRLFYAQSEVANAAPPPSAHFAAFSNRLWALSTDADNTVHFSKNSVEGEPVNFAESGAGFVVNVQDDDNEGITGLASLDGQLIVFKPTKVYQVTGVGPNNAGGDSDLTQPELVTADVGCDNVDSIVPDTPAGIVFRSSRGIMLLDRSRNTTYVGADVEAYNDLDVTAGVLVPSRDQVRFLTRDGTALVFDYRAQRWCTWTNHPALDAVLAGNRFYYVRPDGSVYAESTHFRDDDESIALRAVTGWISPAGLQGFSRVYDTWLVGEYRGPHALRWRFSYDFDEDTVDEMSQAVTDEQPYEYGVHLGHKCTAIRIEVQDVQPADSDPYNEGMELTAIALRVGRKPGLNRLGESRKR